MKNWFYYLQLGFSICVLYYMIIMGVSIVFLSTSTDFYLKAISYTFNKQRKEMDSCTAIGALYRQKGKDVLKFLPKIVRPN